ncbi:unnamed protein product [Clonostachys rosea f. rosea IK726]|uniref:Amino acid permease/ SLC12A domain-containing protein n=2 Tax=Bionectria ochroleuca TaxID=29856 RepID=A0A0B7JNW8_BIOOC|nr:unnamed protein product [Clonostachys rosea f. rosea IK726]
MTVQHHDGIIPTEHDALLPRPLQPPAGDSEPGVPAQDDPFASGDVVTAEEHRSFQRGLEQRHLSMIGIAGAIGTGLFLGLGGAVQTGGPLGALLGYGVIGLVVCAVQFALGEVAALLPVTGSYVRHAEFLVDPAWGVALGYNLVYGNILSIPSEITAICVLFRFCFLSLSSGALVVFWWFVDLTAAGILVSWSSILYNHIRLRSAMRVQGIPESRLPWYNKHTVYTSRAALCMCVLILFTSGFSTFIKGHWDTSVFVSSYLDIPLVLSVFLIWKFWKNTKPIPLHKIPLLEVLDQIDESSE